LLHALVTAGADIIELGVPFSDPMADGPTIQKATERALLHDVSLTHVLQMVREFRAQNTTTPVVLMGYLNPIEVMGYNPFAHAAAQAGVDGVLTVDLPPEEASTLNAALSQHNIDSIFLLSPTTTETRIKRICAASSGYVYYVSLRGVTGASHIDLNEVQRKLASIRQVSDLPISVGFGIKDANTAAQVARIADAVIVGSALVNQIEALSETPDAIVSQVPGILADMRSAMDAIETH